MFTYEDIARTFEQLDYTVYEDARGYDLNLYGIRTDNLDSGEFNDYIGVFYVADRQWINFLFPATTDPGLYWRENPMNVDGTAILKPGQYKDAFRLGTHKGYPALVQASPLPVYRDSNKDSYLDLDESTVQTGMFGINLHRASLVSTSHAVWKWSAGCQVVQDAVHFSFLLDLVDKAKSIYGNSFTYTLLTEEQVEAVR